MSTITLPFAVSMDDAANEFKVAEAGEYTLEVKKTEVKKSNAGNQMINIGLQIIDDEDFGGTYVWETLVLIESCKFKMAQFMAAAGLDMDSAELDLDEWIGETVQVVLDVESYTNGAGQEVEKNVIKRYIF